MSKNTTLGGAPRFEFVIEAGLDELIEICEGNQPRTSQLDVGVFYAEVIVHFLRGEQEQLSKCASSVYELFSAHEDVEYLNVACRLREQIRLRTFDPELLAAAIKLSLTASRWMGELFILLATAHTIMDQYERAQELMLKPYPHLKNRAAIAKRCAPA
jgi:hypothetical protein